MEIIGLAHWYGIVATKWVSFTVGGTVSGNFIQGFKTGRKKKIVLDPWNRMPIKREEALQIYGPMGQWANYYKWAVALGTPEEDKTKLYDF